MIIAHSKTFVMIKDENKQPCVLEYSEEQKCWHINTGEHEITSNGYEPLAMGSMHTIVNLKRLVDARLEEGVTRLADIRETLWETLWEYAELLPDVRYCVEPKKRKK